MNPETRRLQQITIDDLETDEAMLITCMGEEVAPRKEFILQMAAKNSQEAEVIDETHIPVEEM